MREINFYTLDSLLKQQEPVRAPILLRTGEMKAHWQSRLFGISLSNNPSTWDEDGHDGPLSVTSSSARKSSSLLENSDDPSFRFATDIEYLSEDKQRIRKPRHATSRDEIFNMLVENLRNLRTFKVISGSSMYDPIPERQLGITEFERIKFSTASFDPGLLELYVYGVRGRNGNSPSHLQKLADKMVGKLGDSCTILDTIRLSVGHSLEELKTTSMGWRWPSPVFQGNIIDIDGVGRGSPDFASNLSRLYWTMLGAPQRSRMLLNWHQSQGFEQRFIPGRSLYPEIEGHWVQMLSVNSRNFLIQRFVPADAAEISAMARSNFYGADNYANLTSTERLKYAEANNPQGVIDVSTHPDNLCALVVREIGVGHNPVAAWRVLRWKGDSVEGKRLHVSPDHRGIGIGKSLLRVGEGLALDKGAKKLVINSSGDSAPFFERMGYGIESTEENGDGVFESCDFKPSKVILSKSL